MGSFLEVLHNPYISMLVPLLMECTWSESRNDLGNGQVISTDMQFDMLWPQDSDVGTHLRWSRCQLAPTCVFHYNLYTTTAHMEIISWSWRRSLNWSAKLHYLCLLHCITYTAMRTNPTIPGSVWAGTGKQAPLYATFITNCSRER